MTESVNHPDHYNQGSIECLDAIEASMTSEEFLGFLKGNVMKYLWRWRQKGKGAEDIEKALFYLSRMPERVRAEMLKASRAVVVPPGVLPPVLGQPILGQPIYHAPVFDDLRGRASDQPVIPGLMPQVIAECRS